MSLPSYHGLDHHVGNTPLIRLKKLSELTGCEILGKAEFMNPGGSVKDRAAYGIITDAEARGLLKPGQTMVEGTAGNTGIGLTVIGENSTIGANVFLMHSIPANSLVIYEEKNLSIKTKPARKGKGRDQADLLWSI